jgi:hypothetical protein
LEKFHTVIAVARTSSTFYLSSSLPAPSSLGSNYSCKFFSEDALSRVNSPSQKFVAQPEVFTSFIQDKYHKAGGALLTSLSSGMQQKGGISYSSKSDSQPDSLQMSLKQYDFRSPTMKQGRFLEYEFPKSPEDSPLFLSSFLRKPKKFTGFVIVLILK